MQIVFLFILRCKPSYSFHISPSERISYREDGGGKPRFGNEYLDAPDIVRNFFGFARCMWHLFIHLTFFLPFCLSPLLSPPRLKPTSAHHLPSKHAITTIWIQQRANKARLGTLWHDKSRYAVRGFFLSVIFRRNFFHLQPFFFGYNRIRSLPTTLPPKKEKQMARRHRWYAHVCLTHFHCLAPPSSISFVCLFPLYSSNFGRPFSLPKSPWKKQRGATPKAKLGPVSKTLSRPMPMSACKWTLTKRTTLPRKTAERDPRAFTKTILCWARSVSLSLLLIALGVDCQLFNDPLTIFLSLSLLTIIAHQIQSLGAKAAAQAAAQSAKERGEAAVADAAAFGDQPVGDNEGFDAVVDALRAGSKKDGDADSFYSDEGSDDGGINKKL